MNPGDFMIVFSLEAELTTVRAGVSQASSCRKRHMRRARLRSNGTATNETARARWPSSIRMGTGFFGPAVRNRFGESAFVVSLTSACTVERAVVPGWEPQKSCATDVGIDGTESSDRCSLSKSW